LQRFADMVMATIFDIKDVFFIPVDHETGRNSYQLSQTIFRD